MRDFLIDHKILLIVLAVVLSGVYLFFALYPGYWYNDTFLTKQSDGSYQGSGYYGQYTLLTDGNTVTVHNDDLTHVYQFSHNGDSLQINVDGHLIFNGIVVNDNGKVVLRNNNSSYNISVYSDIYADVLSNVYIVGDQCPSPAWIYHFLNGQNIGTRGNGWMLALAWLFIAAWVLDILFPEFMFRFHVWGIVEGGTPGWRYEAGQYIRRIFLPIIAVIFLFVGFFPQ
jgi:hypothetical protein